MKVDHVLIAVQSLDEAARKLERRHGLASVEGGRHPGLGTANRIVPLGDSYLELIAVVDEAQAARTPMGCSVAAQATAAGHLTGWAVRTTDLDAIAARLDIAVEPGERLLPDGGTLNWRFAGVAEAADCPLLPFFIEWDTLDHHPGRAPARGRAQLAGLLLEGDGALLADWLGPHELPVAVSPGGPAVVGVRIATPDGELVIRG